MYSYLIPNLISQWSLGYKLEQQQVCCSCIIPRGIVFLAWLHQLLDCKWRLLGLGTPVLRLGACALGVGTVLDVCKLPLVRGFVMAAGWLPPGAFFGVTWHWLSHIRFGSCRHPRIGIVQCQRGVGTVQHRHSFGGLFHSCSFHHGLTRLVWKSVVCRSRGVPFELLQFECAKKCKGSWVMLLSMSGDTHSQPSPSCSVATHHFLMSDPHHGPLPNLGAHHTYYGLYCVTSDLRIYRVPMFLDLACVWQLTWWLGTV